MARSCLEEKTYARTYMTSRELAKGLPADTNLMQEAHLLLQQHGQTLCKRSVPRCEACPLSPVCAYATLRRVTISANKVKQKASKMSALQTL